MLNRSTVRLTALVSILLVVIMAGGNTAAVTPKYGGTLTVGVAQEIKVLDPHMTTLGAFNRTLRYTVFETLVDLDDNGTYLPQLATSWSHPNDVTMKINLKKGVKFHDGSEMTSEDVEFSLERVMDKKFASPFLPQLATVKSVEAPDRYTIVLNLIAPSPAILTSLSYVQILGKKSIGQINTHPIGTGPFEFVEWLLNDRLVVKKFNNYWQEGRPYLDKVVYKPISDTDARLSNLRAGSFDLIESPNFKDVSLIKADPKLQVIATPPSSYNCVQMNCQKAPTNDVRIRKAIAYCFDREAYVRDVLYGYGKVAIGPFASNSWVYNPIADKTYGYNLQKAAALIAEAGYPGGKGLELEIVHGISSAQSGMAGVMLQAALNSIGVKVTIKKLDSAAWIDYHITKGLHQINFNTFTYSGVVDPSAVFNVDNLAPTFNAPRYYNQEYSDLVMKGATTMDKEERKKIYSRLQEKLAEDMPMFLISHFTYIYGARKGLHDYTPGAAVRFPLTDAWLE